MDKNSFLIYLDYEEQFNLLTDEQIGQLMRAIIKYEKTKEIPQLDGMLKMAFSFIKTQLDRDREKYEAKCEKNRENGARGGRPKKKQEETEKPNGFKENQMDAKKPDNDNEDDNEDDNDNEDEEDKKVVCPYQQILDLYHTTCKSYPKIKILSKSRKQTIKSRYIEYKKDINVFKEMFEKVENSNFLKGCNDRKWSANFDWMLKSSNMIKILEDNYKNKEESNGNTGQDNAKYSKVDFAKNRARETEREIDDSGLI